MSLWVFVLGGGAGFLVAVLSIVPVERWEAIREGRRREAKDHEMAIQRASLRRAIGSTGSKADVLPFPAPTPPRAAAADTNREGA
jgi:hypothetical protein